jgi:hypothetical protein
MPKIHRTCRTCGVEFGVWPARLSASPLGAEFCSRSCRHAAKLPRAPRTTLADQLARFIDKTGDCWLWTGGKNKGGYGVIFDTKQRKTRIASRVIWESTNGLIPDGLFVLHRCDNPPCVNPEHLFLGTPHDNNQDMMRKGRCATFGDANWRRQNPPKGERNGRAKLTREIVEEIRSRFAAGGETQTALAREYGVIQAHISRILKREAWA